MELPKEEWIEDPLCPRDKGRMGFLYQSYEDGKHWVWADVRFDGCIHYQKAYNSPFPKILEEDKEDQDYMHICDIDKLIKQLTELKEAAKKYFGEDWGKN